MPNEESYLNESLRKIAKGAGIVFMGALIGRAFGYGSRIVIARFLGVSDYGLISLGFAALTMAAVLAAIGLPSGVTRYVSFYKGKEEKGKIKGTIISAIKMNLPISVIFALLLFFGADWISVHIFHDANLTPVLRIFSIAVPFLVLAQNLLSATVGFQEMRYQVYTQQIFQEVFKLACIVALVALGFGVIGAAWGWAVAIILMPFLAFYFLQKKVFPIFNSRIKAISTDRELFSFSWPLIFVGMAGIVMGFTDTLMLGYFCGAYEVGIYNAALPTAMLVNMPSLALASLFMPVITELYARERYGDLKNAYSAVIKWILSLAFPAFLLMALFADDVIKILFGAEYVMGANALAILAFGFFVSTVLGRASDILSAFGRTKIIMVVSFATAAVNFCLNLYLIPIFGINGAAMATALSSVFVGLLYFIVGYSVSKMQPFKRNYLKPIFAAIVAVLIVYVLTKYLIGVSFFALIVMFFVFLLIYFFLLLLMKGFDENDLMIMRAIDERVGMKSDWIRGIIKRFL
jgi:O-antigen/teichoic acid export membrane protein